MAKKPAPLTSQLLVRKGEATPSSINPEDRATHASDEPDYQPEPEMAQAPTTHEAASETAPVSEPVASEPAEASASFEPRPQTPEPEFILATDEDEEERGSKRRLVGVLALVAVSVIGAAAFAILGGDANGPSVAPSGEITFTDRNAETATAEAAAPVLTPSSPQSVGAPAAPAEVELRPGLNAGTQNATAVDPETAAVAPVTPAAPVAEATPATTVETPAAATATPELPQPAPARAPIRLEPIVEPEVSVEAPAAPQPAAVAPAAAPAGSLAQKGQYLIQLLASRSEADARRAWARVQSRHGAIIGGAALDLETADLGERGTYYRVRFGAFDDRSAANAVCKALKDKGQDCLVKRAE